MSELVAAVVAVILTILYTHGKDWLDDRKQERSERRMLSLEVDRNLKLARELKHDLERAYNRPTETEDFEHNGASLANWMLKLSPPPWSQAIWNSHVSITATSISTDQVEGLLTHHGHLDRMKGYLATFSALRLEQTHAPDRTTQFPNRGGFYPEVHITRDTPGF
jgi:hypothetical protein